MGGGLQQYPPAARLAPRTLLQRATALLVGTLVGLGLERIAVMLMPGRSLRFPLQMQVF